MKAGQLNQRIAVLHRVKETDESGATVYVWRDYWLLWANVRHTSGAETLKHDVLTASVKASIRVRMKQGITPDMRVRVGAALYKITAVIPDLVSRQYMDLVCESLADENDGRCEFGRRV